jgi:UPF0042 nucleotide-binding protein
MQVILVSGLSGSGKSIALAALEDAGIYCVDNLPATLLPPTLAFLENAGNQRAAIAIDARSGESFRELPSLMSYLRERHDVRTLFLEAKTEALVKRFSETRRRHPLSQETRSLGEAIALEREWLSEIAEMGTRMDTSDLSPSALRAWVKDFLGLDRSRLTLLFESFGFKHGIPLDADLVFDVRCLPNPHYDPVLRPLTGRDAAVIEFLEKETAAGAMLDDIRVYIAKWLPCFVRDNRAYLTVAIGCTGGQHRSVYFAEKLAARFRGDQQVLVRHRELS